MVGETTESKNQKTPRKITIGLLEKVTILGKDQDTKKTLEKSCTARIDTGAKRSSLDINLAKTVGIVPSKKKIIVKSASGKSVRPLVKAKVILKKRTFRTEITLIDRSNLKYKCLIGRDILSKGFMIDATKKGVRKK